MIITDKTAHKPENEILDKAFRIFESLKRSKLNSDAIIEVDSELHYFEKQLDINRDQAIFLTLYMVNCMSGNDCLFKVMTHVGLSDHYISLYVPDIINLLIRGYLSFPAQIYRDEPFISSFHHFYHAEYTLDNDLLFGICFNKKIVPLKTRTLNFLNISKRITHSFYCELAKVYKQTIEAFPLMRKLHFEKMNVNEQWFLLKAIENYHFRHTLQLIIYEDQFRHWINIFKISKHLKNYLTRVNRKRKDDPDFIMQKQLTVLIRTQLDSRPALDDVGDDLPF